jgi:hypothetical protein
MNELISEGQRPCSSESKGGGGPFPWSAVEWVPIGSETEYLGEEEYGETTQLRTICIFDPHAAFPRDKTTELTIGAARPILVSEAQQCQRAATIRVFRSLNNSFHHAEGAAEILEFGGSDCHHCVGRPVSYRDTPSNQLRRRGATASSALDQLPSFASDEAA